MLKRVPITLTVAGAMAVSALLLAGCGSGGPAAQGEALERR